MINKKQSRLRRARATRARILLQKVDRLTVHRTNLHIYASIISADNPKFALSSRAFPVAAATSLPRRSWVPASPRRRRLPVLSPAPSIVRATVSTAVSPRWLKPRAKPASSSKQGLANG